MDQPKTGKVQVLRQNAYVQTYTMLT